MTHLQLAQTVACTEAEGPGKRFALWFQSLWKKPKAQKPVE
jgi:hypothetical protein